MILACKFSFLPSYAGEIEVHHGPTHIEEEDESKLHSDTEVEAPEGGHGALKETVFKVSQEPGQDSEMVEGNGSDYDHNAALDCSIRESSFIGKVPFSRMLNLMG